MADKPILFPHFAIDDIVDVLTGQLNWAEPPQNIKDEGIKYLTATNRQHINWALRLCNFWIEWLEQEVEQNTSDISNNTANIATNTSDIATNRGDIDNNIWNINNLSDAIIQNTSDITTQGNQIATNISRINDNESDINQNAGDISNNTSDISTLQNNLNYVDSSKNFDFSNIGSGLGLAEYTRVGRNVTVYFPNFVGTTTAATMFLQAFGAPAEFPSSMRPYTYPIWLPCQVVVSGVERLGALRWVDITQLQLYFLEPYESVGNYFNRLQPNFPIGGVCGIREQCITYRSFD